MTLPVILRKQNHIAVRRFNIYFPSENPKLFHNFGGRVMTLPYNGLRRIWRNYDKFRI